MADVQRLSVQIAFNPRLGSLIYEQKPMGARGRFIISQFQKDLRTYKIANGYIDELYVFFQNSDIIMSSLTTYSMEFLASNLDNIEKISSKQFEAFDDEYDMGIFKNMQIYEGTDNEKSTIVHIQSLPFGLNTNTKATLLILLDYEAFLNEITNIDGLDKGTVLILNKNSDIIAQANTSQDMEGLVYQDFQSSMLHHKTIGGNEYIVSNIDSQINEWKYLFILPYNLFMDKVRYIKNLIGISVTVCLLIGGLVSYFLTKRNYNPVQELVMAIANTAGIQLNPEINEYKFIQQAMNNTVTEKEIIQQKLNKQNAALRSNFLARLIKGSRDQSISIEEALYTYNIRWVGDSYCVLLFYFDSSDKKGLAGMPLGDTYKLLELVRYIIANVVNETIGQKHKVFITEVDNMTACLVNVNGEHASAKLDIANMAARLIKLMRESFSLSLTISIGNINRTYAGIVQSYQEAQEAMEYRMVMGNERVILYDEIENPDRQYNYPLEMEQQLINAIKIGDLKTARDIMNNVFQDHFSKGILSIEMTKCLLFDLISTMIKAMNDLNIQDSSHFIEELNPVVRLSSADTVIKMKYEMMYILQKVCEHVDSGKRDHYQKITNKIISIIDNNYNDANLCITRIASELGLTGPYISKIFRDQMGESIQDYINKARLSLAKKLLVENQSNLDTIAREVGYTNSNGLIRIFKKYEGLTPGQFREISDSPSN